MQASPWSLSLPSWNRHLHTNKTGWKNRAHANSYFYCTCDTVIPFLTANIEIWLCIKYTHSLFLPQTRVHTLTIKQVRVVETLHNAKRPSHLYLHSRRVMNERVVALPTNDFQRLKDLFQRQELVPVHPLPACTCGQNQYAHLPISVQRG